MKPRFTIQEKMENLCLTDMKNYCYISMIFDVNRGGVADIAEKIMLFLDYKSLKQFKKTCKSVHRFINDSKIEQILFERMPTPLSGCLEMAADWEDFQHNLCDELTRLRPKISFAHGYGDCYELRISAIPRKHEDVQISENKEKNEDSGKYTSDQITWEEFLEKHTDHDSDSDSDSENPQWVEFEGMIGKTPSAALWNISDKFGDIFETINNPECQKCDSSIYKPYSTNWLNCLSNNFRYKPEDKYEDIEEDQNEMENVMMSCIKNEQVKEELLNDVEDFKKLVKKRGSFGACILPDAFGRIVKFMNHRCNHVDTFCIFATEAYCYYISYLS